MTRRERLFDTVKRRRWRGSKALVPFDPKMCPECGGGLEPETVTEMPLLRHGGYGAGRATTRMHCRCGWSYVPVVVEVRP